MPCKSPDIWIYGHVPVAAPSRGAGGTRAVLRRLSAVPPSPGAPAAPFRQLETGPRTPSGLPDHQPIRAFQAFPTSLQKSRTLLRDHAQSIWTGVRQPNESGEWGITVDVERARSFRTVSTVPEFLEVEAAIHRAYSAPMPRSGPFAQPTSDTESDIAELGISPGETTAQISLGGPQPAPGRSQPEDMRVSISNRTIATLASPFQHGNGPSPSPIVPVWTEADASEYLGEGNKIGRAHV